MKKIIKNKTYDTETAEYRGCGGNNLPDSNSSYYSERLYEKRTGEFFLQYEGGPMSKYAISEGYNQTSGGYGIRPLTYRQAKDWAKDNLTDDEYKEIFCKVDGSNEKEYKRYCISKAAAEKLKRAAAAEGKMPSEYLEEILMKL